MKKIFVLSVILLLVSCSQEEVYTQGEWNAIEINRLVAEKFLDNVTIYIQQEAVGSSYWHSEVYQQSFVLEHSFIKADDQYYSLELLFKFSYEEDTLLLYYN